MKLKTFLIMADLWMYMGTLGNRPDLFGSSSYVGRYYGSEYPKYEIPPEALEDEQFAAIIKEAEKYLGFPYVWGGSSPSTSFDCSGFVSYVYNNCGLGWSFGRLGAEGLRQICAYVSPANAKPGDLIFFQGTYDTTGASHVGIYIAPLQRTELSNTNTREQRQQHAKLAGIHIIQQVGNEARLLFAGQHPHFLFSVEVVDQAGRHAHGEAATELRLDVLPQSGIIFNIGDSFTLGFRIRSHSSQ